MRALLLAVLVVVSSLGAVASAALPDALASPRFLAAGTGVGSCGPLIVFKVDGASGTGSVASQGASCHHSALFLNNDCVLDLVCSGECRMEADGAGVCWYGTPEPDPVASGSYVRLDPDGAFLWLQYGLLEAHGTLMRVDA